MARKSIDSLVQTTVATERIGLVLHELYDGNLCPAKLLRGAKASTVADRVNPRKDNVSDEAIADHAS